MKRISVTVKAGFLFTALIFTGSVISAAEITYLLPSYPIGNGPYQRSKAEKLMKVLQVKEFLNFKVKDPKDRDRVSKNIKLDEALQVLNTIGGNSSRNKSFNLWKDAYNLINLILKKMPRKEQVEFYKEMESRKVFPNSKTRKELKDLASPIDAITVKTALSNMGYEGVDELNTPEKIMAARRWFGNLALLYLNYILGDKNIVGSLKKLYEAIDTEGSLQEIGSQIIKQLKPQEGPEVRAEGEEEKAAAAPAVEIPDWLNTNDLGKIRQYVAETGIDEIQKELKGLTGAQINALPSDKVKNLVTGLLLWRYQEGNFVEFLGSAEARGYFTRKVLPELKKQNLAASYKGI